MHKRKRMRLIAGATASAPAAHPLHAYATKAAGKIHQESNGRLEIRTFANNALGGPQSIISSKRRLRTGLA